MARPIVRVTDVVFPRFQAPDLDAMEAFLGVFGMHRTARTPNALYMRGTDRHHHVHVTHRGEPAFLGLAFAAGSRENWGIGRHILGGQVFDYWKDPLGFTVEHWTDSDLLVADTPAGSHHILNALSQWGPPPPPDLDF